MRRVEQAAVRIVRCHVCHQEASSVWGFVEDERLPDNHLAPCGLPCIGGGISLDTVEAHDQDACPRCATA